MVNYSFKPRSNDVVVSVFNHSDLSYYQNIEQEIVTAGNQYGFQVQFSRLNASEKKCLIKHAIVILQSDNVALETEAWSGLLEDYNTMSLVFTYFTQEKMEACKDIIDNLKIKYNDRLNYLRPDIRLDSGEYVVSSQKLIDNSICDTVRIKYKPLKNDEASIHLTEEYQNYFTDVSRLYADHKLYHRSPKDGFFAARMGEKFYITATKTYKDPLDLDRVSLVHYYNEASNELCYSGNFLPSSDVVEASIVFRDNPEITALIHTHASEKYTRNPQFKNKIKVPRNSYGTASLGHEINSVILSHLNDFIILEEHGELFAMTGPVSDATRKLEDILNIPALV